MKINNSQKTAVIALIALFLVDFLLYQKFQNYYVNHQIDKIFHFGGGFFTGLFFLNYLKRITISKNGLLKNILILAGVSLFIGVLWEFSEYAISKIANNELNIDDTLSDLSFDTLGVIVMFLIHLLSQKHSHKKWGLY